MNVCVAVTSERAFNASEFASVFAVEYA